MQLRNKLLLYFVSLILVTLAVFGYSAFQISYDSAVENDTAVMEARIAGKSNKIADDYKKNRSLNHAMKHLLSPPDENHAWLILNKKNNIVFPEKITTLFSKNIHLFLIKKLINSEVYSGSLNLDNTAYIWTYSDIEGTNYKLFYLMKPNHAIFKARFSKLASRLFVTALIITWIAVWLALIITTTVTRKIKSHVDAEHELDAANKKLKEAKDSADKANQAKSAFLSNMSHELRTPLNAIIGFSQLIEITSKEENSIKYSKEILKGGDHLLALINEILDLSKIEAGYIDLDVENCKLNELLGECISLIQPTTLKNSINIINNIPNNDYIIKVDHTRFKQVLLNLLSNAVKYNRNEGSVTISCEIKPNQRMKISITDTGKGLHPEQVNQLFKAFERLDVADSSIEGTGIGLVITKRLIEFMSGEIGVESLPGQGTTFWVEINLSSENNEYILNDAISQNTIIPNETTSSDLNKIILYIEDNHANVRLVENILDASPYTLVSAADGSLGLKLVDALKPDLILLDINLPKMNGYEIMKQLQTKEETREIPVIALSANAMESDIKKSEDAGFHQYLTKPIDVQKLLSSIDSALK